MKPDNEDTDDNKNCGTVTGDVIGNTAYSERFVLKLLLKLTKLDTLKSELQQETIEDDLCTLWDMTAERDVVLFLLKHEALNLFDFAWSTFESPRILEVMIGLIGNMCCQKEAVDSLLKIESLLKCLMEYSKCDDSLILIQLLRLLNSNLYLSEDIEVWMKLFIETEYSIALFNILNNSLNKDLLIAALENFNAICTYCNIESVQCNFFHHFVTREALLALSSGFTEIINQRESCENDEFERMIIVTLSILLNLVGFEQSSEIYSENKNSVLKIISYIFSYYEVKFCTKKQIDVDLIDIVLSSITIIKCLQLCETSEQNQFFQQTVNMWKTTDLIPDSEDKEESFECDNTDMKTIWKQLKTSLSSLLLLYIDSCSQNCLSEALGLIEPHFETILSTNDDTKLKTSVTRRTREYKNQLKIKDNC